MWHIRFKLGRKLLLILTLCLLLTPTAFAQDSDEEDAGFFTSLLQRLGIGEQELEEGEEAPPLIDPQFIPPIVAGIALGVAGTLIFLGYQAPPPKRDPFNRRL